MTALEQSLRVDIARVKREGYSVTVVREPRRYPRGKDMPNVTAAVAAYENLSDKPWGCLTRIAEEFKTTPGSILGRIRKRKLHR